MTMMFATQRLAQRSAIAALLVVGVFATLAPGLALAAECPISLEAAKKLVLLDNLGNRSIVEPLADGLIRRTETIQAMEQATVMLSGVIPQSQTTTTSTSQTTSTNQFSAEQTKQLNAFLPPRPGTTLTLDYATTMASSGGNKQTFDLRSIWTVTGGTKVIIGDCTYATLAIETTFTRRDGSFTSKGTSLYAPELKTWLDRKFILQSSGKPDRIDNRAIVSISTAN